MSSSLHGVLHVLDSTTNKSRPLTLASNVLAVDNSNNTQPISASSLPLPSGAATDTSVQAITSALGSLATDSSVQSVTTALSGVATDVSVQAITSALSGTITTTQAVSKAETSLNSASSVAASDFSASHDATGHRKVAIFGSTTDTSNNIDVYVSQDNSTFYKMGQFSIYPDFSGEFGMIVDAPFKYLKLKYLGTATVTAIAAGSN